MPLVNHREREGEKKRKKPARIKNHVKIVQFQRPDGILLRHHRELPESRKIVKPLRRSGCRRVQPKLPEWEVLL